MRRFIFSVVLLIASTGVNAQRVANVRTIVLDAGEAQSTVVPPGKKTQCGNGRFLVTSDGRRPPEDVVLGRDLDQTSGEPIVSDFKMGTLSANISKYEFGTNDHDLMTLSNGDVLYVTGAFSRMAVDNPSGKKELGWLPLTSRGAFGPGARSVVLTWRSTDCGETFDFVGEFDPARMSDPSCAFPQYRLLDPCPPNTECRIFQKPYDMGGTDGQFTRVGPGDRLYMTYQCVGYKKDPTKTEFTLTKEPLNKTLFMTSNNAGASWILLGTINTTWWRFGIVPLEGESFAFGFSNYLTFGTKPPNASPSSILQYKFSGAEPTPDGGFGWAPGSFDENANIPKGLIRANVWSSTIAARAPASKNALIVFPESIPGKGHGYRVFFHDPVFGFGEGKQVLPKDPSDDNFIMHLVAIDMGKGPILLYWYDVNGKDEKGTVRGRIITGEFTQTDDFAVSQSGGSPRSFNLVKHTGETDVPWYGDYLTAGGYIRPQKVSQTTLGPKTTTTTYAFFPMWVESTTAGNVIRYTSVEFDEKIGSSTLPPDLFKVQLSKRTKRMPVELSRIKFNEREMKVLRDYHEQSLRNPRVKRNIR